MTIFLGLFHICPKNPNCGLQLKILVNTETLVPYFLMAPTFNDISANSPFPNTEFESNHLSDNNNVARQLNPRTLEAKNHV